MPSRSPFFVLATFLVVFLPALSGCGRSVEGPLPSTTGADPQVVCGEQLETLVTIRGEGFSPAPVDGLTDTPRLALPRVTLLRIGDIDGSALPDGGTWILNEDATDTTNDRVLWTSQEELSLRLDEILALERGLYDVHVENATGGEARLVRAFASVPPPVLNSIEPLPVCTAQHTNTLVLSGSWFLTIGGTAPTVTIGDRDYVPTASGCETVDTPRDDEVERCETLTVQMGVDDLAPGPHDVVVTNPEPAQCQTTEAVVFHVVPPPSISSVTDQPICLAEESRSLVVSGTGFLQIRGDLPDVRIGDVPVTLVNMSGCQPIEGLADVNTCTTLDISVEQEALLDGRHAVVVTNPAPAHCYSEESETLTVVPPPSLTAVSPQPICNAQSSTSLTLTGSGFLEIRGSMPQVYVNDVLAASVAVVDESCAMLPDTDLDSRACTELVAVFDESALEAGLASVRVENPLPAGCTSIDETTLAIVPPPMLASVEPNPVCVAQTDMPVTLIGSGFLEIEGQVGSITLESTATGAIVLPIDAAAVEGYCTPVAGVEDVRSCTRVSALIQSDSLVEGDTYLVTLTNPAPAACVTTEAVELGVVPPPDLDPESITPAAVCTGGAVFTVQGTNLTGIDAYLQNDTDTAWAANVDVNEEGTQASLFFTALQPGQYRLFVTGAGGCGDATEGMAITVETGPTIFFVDPPVVYNGVAMRVSIYITRLTDAPTQVAIIPSDRTDETGEILLTDIFWDAARPNLVQATIPLPADAPIAPGSYDVIVRGLEGCDAFMEEGILVVGETTIALATPAIIPEFGEAGSSVAVGIRALDAADRAVDEVGFEATPRAYLSSGLLATAEPLRAVTFESDTLLTAVVPGLAEGSYDLIVVNPAGSVGFAANAYRATSIAPPVIDEVYPTQVENGNPVDLTITGANFFFDTAGAELGLTVTAICRDSQGTITDYPLPIGTGASDSVTWSMLIATLPGGISHGSACVIRVDNTTNATFDEWSALTVTNPASKLPPFQATSDLVEPRRAPSMAVGRPTREARFVYAIGGDSGTFVTAKSSVEASSVGRFGELGTWRVLQTGLVDDNRQPTTRTLAVGHRDGRFLYLLGGMTDAEEVVSDVLRSLVLDPLPPSVPEIFDVDIDFVTELVKPDPESPQPDQGLGVGAWTYMVSAVMADGDPENPAGETLPSEAMTLYLPDVPGGMSIALTWTTVYGPGGDPAQAYRVYRTPHADAPISETHLIAVVPGTAAADHSFLDNDPDPMSRPGADAAKVPLRLGALGTWHHVADLAIPRAAFSLGVAADPSPIDPLAPGQYWYAIGGMSMDVDAGGALVLVPDTSSYDYAHFDPDSAAIGAFATETTNLLSRREHGVWTATAENADFISDPIETWIYVGLGHYGDFAAPSTRNHVHYAKVLTDGRLGQPGVGTGADSPGTFNSANPSNFSRGGMAALIAANQIYIMGGKSGASAVNTASAAEIQSTSPNLKNIQSAANDLLVARYLPGFARRGAFLYLAGGADAAGNAISSTEMNVR